MTHYKIEADDTEVFCTGTDDWVHAPFDSSDTGPACAICSFCNTLLVDDDKPVVPHHIHLGSQWYCNGQQGVLLPKPDFTEETKMNCYACSECPAALILTEHGRYPDGA